MGQNKGLKHEEVWFKICNNNFTNPFKPNYDTNFLLCKSKKGKYSSRGEAYHFSMILLIQVTIATAYQGLKEN
jgi:hypothetical protein